MAGKQGIILDADLTNTVYIYEEMKSSQPFIVILLLVFIINIVMTYLTNFEKQKLRNELLSWSIAFDARWRCKVVVVDTCRPSFSPIKNKTVPFPLFGQAAARGQRDALRPLKTHQLPCSVVLLFFCDCVRVVSCHVHLHNALMTRALGAPRTVVHARRALLHRAKCGVATPVVWKKRLLHVFELVQFVFFRFREFRGVWVPHPQDICERIESTPRTKLWGASFGAVGAYHRRQRLSVACQMSS